MRDFLRSLFRPAPPRGPIGCDYDVTREGPAVVLAVQVDGRPRPVRYVMTPTTARKLAAALAMEAGEADGRDD